MLRLVGTIRICKNGDATLHQNGDSKYYVYKGVSLVPNRPEQNQMVTFFDWQVKERRAKLIKEGAIIEVSGKFSSSIEQKDGESVVSIRCNVDYLDIILFPPKNEEPQAEEPQKPTKKK